MTRLLRVDPLPRSESDLESDPNWSSDRIAVVIDVLRASTTITQALAAGASRVIPTVDVETARRIQTERAESEKPPLLGGERGGVLIPGFDLGNSPLAYTPTIVANREIVFTTTNGTRALNLCRDARQIVIGCFRNLDIVCHHLSRWDGSIQIVCAGTDGLVSLEDLLCAGRMVSRLRHLSAHFSETESASLAADLCLDDIPIFEQIRYSQGSVNLHRLGLGDDVRECARDSVSDILPVFDEPTASLVVFDG